MTKSQSPKQIAPNSDVCVKLRLYNGSKKLRDVEILSDLDATCVVSLVGAVQQLGDRITEDLHQPQVESLIARAEDAVAKVRVKNPVAVLAMDEWVHTLRGIRKYKVNTNLNAGRNVAHVRIVLDAWPRS